VGDDIRSIEGAPLVAVADVSWALHRAPENGSLSVVVERNGRERSLKLALVPGWRSNADIARRVGTWPMRAMALGGMVLQDLRDEERAERKIPTNSMALLVEHVGEYNEHAAAKKAGFRKDDVLVAIDGRTERITESRLIGEMLQTRKAGDRIKATMLRGTNVMSLAIPVQ
jgi:serine protease Do